uniref:CAHS 5a n=1 Tax=Macrobiotus sp. 2 JF-2022a TaxID=3003600 RepID=A0AAF0AT55_9BILA|nr:CAHS 5a [Macrobiotus sp. 2 JF-2022a]
MEKQHERDIAFRKELMDKAIERQKEEIALEAKYARKELERQREMAVNALDRSKKQTDVQVNIDSGQ